MLQSGVVACSCRHCLGAKGLCAPAEAACSCAAPLGSMLCSVVSRLTTEVNGSPLNRLSSLVLKAAVKVPLVPQKDHR